MYAVVLFPTFTCRHMCKFVVCMVLLLTCLQITFALSFALSNTRKK